MKEHEFDDTGFGPCKGCGKYLEQLIDERFCIMTDKYPNADASPERLAEIERDNAEFGHEHIIMSDMIRDLLAMLHERDRAFDQLKQIANATENRLVATSIERNKLQEQLHEQRWRRLSEEMPPKATAIQGGYSDGEFRTRENDFDAHTVIWLYGGTWEKFLTQIKVPVPDYWRPIPPLPKE